MLRQSGVARVGTWTLFLDACYAGKGLGDVMHGAHDLLESETAPCAVMALCAQARRLKGLETASFWTRWSACWSTVRAQLSAPMPTARGEAACSTPSTGSYILSELFNAVSNEYRADLDSTGGQSHGHILGGAINPQVFPNPQFHEHQPSRLAETPIGPSRVYPIL